MALHAVWVWRSMRFGGGECRSLEGFAPASYFAAEKAELV